MKIRILITLLASLAFVGSAQTLWIVNNSTNSPDSLRVAFSKINSNSVALSNFVATVNDADTNAIVRSGSSVTWSTNVLRMTNGVRYILPMTFTNPAGSDYTVHSGLPYAQWAWAGTTNWSGGHIITTGIVQYAFMAESLPTMGAPIDPVVTNLTVFKLERPDLFGRTNRMVGQTLEVDLPDQPNEVANKRYVDAQVAGVNFMANGGIYLVGSSLNLDGQWQQSASTNGFRLRYLGVDVLNVENPTLSFGTITAISVSSGIVTLSVWTNGITSAPAPQWTADLSHPAWSLVSGYTNSYPTVSGTNYTITFPLPDPNHAFIRVGFDSGAPNFARLSALLATAPRTITNSTSTTWGKGSGLVTWDTNYVYISVGTNLWKRAALSTW